MIVLINLSGDTENGAASFVVKLLYIHDVNVWHDV